MRNNTSHQGFHFGYEDKKIKITQYADDGILFLDNRNEVCSTLNILEMFGALSGLKLNMEKCEGFWLGSDKALQLNCNLFGIKTDADDTQMYCFFNVKSTNDAVVCGVANINARDSHYY